MIDCKNARWKPEINWWSTSTLLVLIPSADHRKDLRRSALNLPITQVCVLSSVPPSYCVDRTRTEDRNSPALFLVSVRILEGLCVSLHRKCWIGHRRVSPSMHTTVSWFVCVQWGTCLFTGFWRQSALNRNCSPSNRSLYLFQIVTLRPTYCRQFG